ncbi:MAG: hypothetical protein AAF211_15200, partial [Myxococcota bacterium]
TLLDEEPPDEPVEPDPTPPGPTDTGPGEVPGTETDCLDGETYPGGAVEPMAFGQVLSPYAWPTAVRHANGQTLAGLDLANVPCALDPDIDWSPFDVLLFVSIPAW